MSSPIEILYDAETEILANIARHLKAGNTASAEWKLDRLKGLGLLNNQTAEIIRRYRDSIHAGTAGAVEQAAMDALIKGEATYARAARAGATMKDVLPLDADPAIRATIEAWTGTARTQMNLAMATMLEKSGEVYVDILNRTTAQVITGASSGREALASAIRDWSAKGIPSIVDKAGRQWSTEAYSNMVIRTNTRRVTTEATMRRAEEYGTDLIEVSAHAGARPGCAPYQGRIYSISGRSSKYPALESTSYGEPDGLFGINCGHIQYPYFEGISRQAYEPTQDEEKNAEQYQESQRQRALERSIRSAKREVTTLTALGDLGKGELAKAKQTLRDRQATMREFIADTGRTRRGERERVYDTGPAAKTTTPPRAPAPRPGSSSPRKPPARPRQPELPEQKPRAPAPTPAAPPKIPQPAPATAPPAAPTAAPPVNKHAWAKIREYPAQPTAAAAAKWAVENDLANIADYTGVGEWAANATNKVLFNSFKKFPALREKMDYLGSIKAIREIYITQRQAVIARRWQISPEDARKIAMREFKAPPKNAVAMAYSSGIEAIGLNDPYWKKEADLRAALKKSVDSGYAPKGTGEPTGIIDHEIGHRIDSLLGWPSSRPGFEKIINPTGKQFTATERAEYLKDNVSGYAADFYYKNAKNPYRYAELAAEAWAEYTNSPEPRPLAKAIGEYFEGKYKEKYQ